MPAKFIQYFDVLSGREEEFRRFASRGYIPGINGTGLLRIVGSWFVAAGEGPYWILESVADSVKDINKLLQLDEFGKLNHLLHFLITNYKTKILAPSGLVEIVVPTQRGFRFNHHYNVAHGRHEACEKLVREAHIPTMERLGIRIIGGWYVVVGPGPNVVVEGSCPSVKQILDAIGSAEYQEISRKLVAMATGFGSKILVPTGLIV